MRQDAWEKAQDLILDDHVQVTESIFDSLMAEGEVEAAIGVLAVELRRANRQCGFNSALSKKLSKLVLKYAKVAHKVLSLPSLGWR